MDVIAKRWQVPNPVAGSRLVVDRTVQVSPAWSTGRSAASISLDEAPGVAEALVAAAVEEAPPDGDGVSEVLVDGVDDALSEGLVVAEDLAGEGWSVASESPPLHAAVHSAPTIRKVRPATCRAGRLARARRGPGECIREVLVSGRARRRAGPA
jgi:hypothetical protein